MAFEILLLLLFMGALAGFVDTLAGGGGMLTLPTLLYVGLPPDAALATNKMQGSVGTVTASLYFLRRGHLKWSLLWPNLIACALGSACGTAAVMVLPKQGLQLALPLVLFAIALILLKMPKLGQVQVKARLEALPFMFAALMPIGFYDGFLGPGTGSFFLMALIALRGLNLQQATIEAKAYNATTNVCSLLVFLWGGAIVWSAAAAMAGGQIIGARLASGMIIRHGQALIRPLAIAMSMLMSLALAYRYWF